MITKCDSILFQFLFLFSIIDNSPASYADYVLPPWADGIGWAMFAVTLSAVLLSAILEVFRVWRDGRVSVIPFNLKFMPCNL